MLEVKPSKRRLYLYPLAIIGVVAVVMFITDRNQEPERIASIHAAVTQWCEATARGEEVRPILPVADPLLTDRLHDALLAACEPLRDADGELVVAVSPGFGPNAGRALEGRGASHHAVIRIGGSQRLGIRFLHVNETPVIVGFWIPDPVDAHADEPTSAIRSREQ